ncbi:MAG: Diacylglycerol kinase [Thermoleophilia bacterium]|nr:Diacylglycerol kinase [Thermoleophilia bacterium]
MASPSTGRRGRGRVTCDLSGKGDTVHVLLVSNPNSGSADQVDPAAVLVERGCIVTDADVETAARWSNEERPNGGRLGVIERVVVAGGDGSVGCAAKLAHRLGIPLGVVPAGTANDFARAMELPTDQTQACILAATGDRYRTIDLGRIGDVPFVNVASFGMAPEAAEEATRFKGVLRALAYPVGAAIAAVRTRPIAVVATVDGVEVYDGRAWQVMLASTGAFGGWANTGKVRNGDGELDLVLVPADRGAPRLAVDAAALVRGELAEREGVFHARGRHVQLHLHGVDKMVVDGEVLDVPGHQIEGRVDGEPLRVVTGR